VTLFRQTSLNTSCLPRRVFYYDVYGILHLRVNIEKEKGVVKGFLGVLEKLFFSGREVRWVSFFLSSPYEKQTGSMGCHDYYFGDSRKACRCKMKTQLQIRNSTADFLVFIRQNGEQGIEVRVEDENVWLTIEALCELFQKKRTTILEHLQNIFKDKELNENSVCRKFRHTATDGKIIKTDVSVAKNYLSKLELI
jgi:hypothetical protein